MNFYQINFKYISDTGFLRTGVWFTNAESITDAQNLAVKTLSVKFPHLSISKVKLHEQQNLALDTPQKPKK